MPSTEKERQDVQKAMAYDLVRLLEKEPDRSYSVKELKDLIDSYITAATQ